MLGSGGIFFSQKFSYRASLSDINVNLINCYLNVRDNVESIVHLLSEHSRIHSSGDSEEYYYPMRELYNTNIKESRLDDNRAALFI